MSYSYAHTSAAIPRYLSVICQSLCTLQMTFLKAASPKFGQFTNIVELHLSGLNGTASQPDMQKIRIKWIFFWGGGNKLHCRFEIGLLLFKVCICF